MTESGSFISTNKGIFLVAQSESTCESTFGFPFCGCSWSTSQKVIALNLLVLANLYNRHTTTTTTTPNTLQLGLVYCPRERLCLGVLPKGVTSAREYVEGFAFIKGEVLRACSSIDLPNSAEPTVLTIGAALCFCWSGWLVLNPPQKKRNGAGTNGTHPDPMILFLARTGAWLFASCGNLHVGGFSCWCWLLSFKSTEIAVCGESPISEFLAPPGGGSEVRVNRSPGNSAFRA